MASSFTEGDVEISEGFFETLKIQRNSSEFSDLVVVAGSSEFNCHRVILAAVSGFFRGLLASGMRETIEGKVTLTDISADVFSELLTCIYSGRSILTKDNIFTIWAAADLLQIDFVLKRCKTLFTKTLAVDNCFHYCASVRLFSEESRKEAIDFIISNFHTVCFSEDLYQLSFEEMKSIVSSDNLSSSCEDEVIETILRWAEFTSTLVFLPEILKTENGDDFDNFFPTAHGAASSSEVRSAEQEKASGDETSTCLTKKLVFFHNHRPRSQKLALLLDHSRHLLTSPYFVVQTLSQHPLVKEHPISPGIVNKILHYQANPGLHQEWCPPAAIHRKGEALKNVFALFSRSGEIFYHNEKGWKKINEASLHLQQPFRPASPIFYCNECLYVFESHSPNRLTIGKSNEESQQTHQNLCFYTPGSHGWRKVPVVETKNQQKKILISQALYIFEEDSQQRTTHVFKLNLRDCVSRYPNTTQWQSVCQLAVKGLRMKGVTSLENKLIIFWAGLKLNSVAVECYDLHQRKSVIIDFEDKFDSEAGMVIFRREKDAFVLQTTGALWRIGFHPRSGQLVCNKRLQLWTSDITLCGMFLYGEVLHILSRKRAQKTDPVLAGVSLKGVFTNICFRCVDPNCFDFPYVHIVLPKHFLQ